MRKSSHFYSYFFLIPIKISCIVGELRLNSGEKTNTNCPVGDYRPVSNPWSANLCRLKWRFSRNRTTLVECEGRAWGMPTFLAKIWNYVRGAGGTTDISLICWLSVSEETFRPLPKASAHLRQQVLQTCKFTRLLLTIDRQENVGFLARPPKISSGTKNPLAHGKVTW